MDTYIGLYFPEKTAEMDRLMNKIQSEGYETYYQCEHVFLAGETKRTDDENYFITTNDTVLLFSGLCFNEKQIIEKSGLQHGATFVEALESLFRQLGDNLFRQIRGYFTLFLYDKLEEKAYIIRDQFGTNLLFYELLQDGFIFSNIKKQLTNILDRNKVDKEALQHYLSFQYVPDPLTLSESVKIVPSGNYVIVNNKNEISTNSYFERTFHPVISDKNFFIKRIREVLYDSVSTMMDGKDSIGSFLSGGIDSTLIASIAKEIKPNIKTFSVGFEREGFSEIDVAKESADKLGLENISKVVTPEEYIEKLPEIIWFMDDPLADPACVPLYFVAREAKKHVDYALSGEGADEFFGGYNIYREPESLKVFNYVPSKLKGGLQKLATMLPDSVKGKSFLERGTTPLHERYIGNAKIFDENEKSTLLRHYDDGISYRDIIAPFYKQVKEEPPTTQMQYVDIHTWLPGDILLKASKMSRANSLTVLMPFIDINVFKVGRELPVHLTIADGTTKNILREAARGIVPDHVLDRKKLGFPVPIRHWLKDELYDWAKTLINESETDEYIDKKAVLNLLDTHAQGKEDLSRKLWTLFIFMIWHQIFIEEKYTFH